MPRKCMDEKEMGERNEHSKDTHIYYKLSFSIRSLIEERIFFEGMSKSAGRRKEEGKLKKGERGEKVSWSWSGILITFSQPLFNYRRSSSSLSIFCLFHLRSLIFLSHSFSPKRDDSSSSLLPSLTFLLLSLNMTNNVFMMLRREREREWNNNDFSSFNS